MGLDARPRTADHGGSHWPSARFMARKALIDRRLEPHDRNQLEFNLTYLIKPGLRRQRYTVEMFMFVPRTLGIDKESYGPDQFFSDVAAFLRLKTPIVPLGLLQRTGETADVRQQSLQKMLCTPDHQEPAIVRELKLLACIFRSACRTRLKLLLGWLATDTDGVAAAFEGFAANVDRARAALLSLAATCGRDTMGARVGQCWDLVDEYTSLIAEDYCTTAVRALERRRPLTAELDQARQALAATAVRQYQHRQALGYPSRVEVGADNEEFPRRRRVLKHSVRSVLYLDVRPDENTARLTADIVGMIAAATAMLFAVTVALWAQVELANTWPFVVAMVVSYMIKDRLKEWGRHYLGRRARHLIPDRVSRIRDGHNRIIGTCSEFVRVQDPDQVDLGAVALRHAAHPDEVSEDGRPEVVVHYSKTIRVTPDVLVDQMDGAEGLNDIIRLNLRRVRERMDAPHDVHHIVRPDTMEVERVDCARTYHLNVVLRLTVHNGGQDDVREEHVRVVMDQRGIKRVEFVDGETR
jgi:hypothetical protein